METEKKQIYEKLTPERKLLVDEIIKNLESGVGLWKKGWNSKEPISAISKKKYRGINRLVLTLISMKENYDDNRWLTFNQMKEQGLRFKTNEEGKSIAKGKGVTIEYFEFRDILTKQPFHIESLNGMNLEERQEYLQENVRPFRKFYCVFNCSLIENMPSSENEQINSNQQSARAEQFFKNWSNNESKIIYGQSGAFYNFERDVIYLPKPSDFYNPHEYYSTALHEIGHSTGHSKRLNRNLKGDRNSIEYALEELRAEISSLFLEQSFEIKVTNEQLRNNSAYIQFWKEKIQDDPNILFQAIADAEKITNFILEKEKSFQELKKQDTPLYELPTEYLKQYEDAVRIPQTKEEGLSQLSKLADKEIVEKAMNSKNDKFKRLYCGEKVLESQSKNELSLLMRLAVYCQKDKEQLLRIFQTSGQFDCHKSEQYYHQLATQAIDFVSSTNKNFSKNTKEELNIVNKNFKSK